MKESKGRQDYKPRRRKDAKVRKDFFIAFHRNVIAGLLTSLKARIKNLCGP